jgi:EasF-like predicted methyltransferase
VTFEANISHTHSDTRKVEHLLAACEKNGIMATYLALDISKSSLDANINYLEERHAHEASTVRCAGLWGTFEDGLQYVQNIKGPRMFLSLGSVLCNDPWSEALRKVKDWADILRPDDLLLVGMDAHLVPKDTKKIWAAYHSREDLYKQFFFNGFDCANQLVGETWFREEDWELLAELEHPTRHRFFFRAKGDTQLGKTGRLVSKGEELDWFDSHKYGQSDVEAMFDKAGLVTTNIWQAPESEFSMCRSLCMPHLSAQTNPYNN